MITTLIFLILALLGLMWYVGRNGQTPGELAITLRVQSIAARGFHSLMCFVSYPGYPPQVIVLGILSVVVPWLLGWKWIAVTLAFGGFGVGFATTAVKHIMQRPRPPEGVVAVHRLLNRGGLSFPAGHSADYVARFGVMVYLLAQSGTSEWWVLSAMAVLLVFIVLVGLSRVYSGEHWLTDVLGGYLLGTIWLIVTIYFYTWSAARAFVESRL